MKTALITFQIILSILIIVAVLMQAQGSGLGLGGGGGESYHTRRGLERVLFYFTIIAVVLFALVSLAVLSV